MSRCALRAAACLVLVGGVTTASASSLVVPDDVATIQMALDAHADTIFVRSGSYAETPTASLPVALLRLDPGSPPPVLAGFVLQSVGTGASPLQFRGLEFTGPVQLFNGNGPIDTIEFTDCRFGAGLANVASDPDTRRLVLERCHISGVAALSQGAENVVDSCVIEGRIATGWTDTRLTVTHSEFHGDGSGAAIGSGNQWGIAAATISGNHIDGYATGIAVEAANLLVEDNAVSNCSSAGITVRALEGPATLRGNVVTGSGDGIEIQGGSDAITVTNNTCAFNAGSGLYVVASESGRDTYTGNIGFGNGGHGVYWALTAGAHGGCNDWFANVGGDVSGAPPSGVDLALDPMFCDAANDDFHLAANSPLVNAAGCGLVGALGVGCDVASVPDNAAFRLDLVGPNPSRGPVQIEFELAHTAAIALEIFDVQGRLVAAPARGAWPTGRHSLVWAGEGRTAAGIYLVRYRYPGGEVRRRVVRAP